MRGVLTIKALGNCAPCPDFSQFTDEELAAAIEETERQAIRELGPVEGRRKLEWVRNMSDEELEWRLNQ